MISATVAQVIPGVIDPLAEERRRITSYRNGQQPGKTNSVKNDRDMASQMGRQRISSLDQILYTKDR
ncbi:hypothetical protein HHI36_017938, partial [Cryptolaemus montrouzieri]